ncbi:hypothetical protein SDC9_18818 [bioreactor metagenome]|uniref:Uncharacterized protein n=1 Tax=bioreactor metagenome TaxID=1076179 RepID=A0A644U1A8_9ZZZZ
MCRAHGLVEPAVDVEPRAAVAHQRADRGLQLVDRGPAGGPGNRDRQADALVERAFAEIIRGHVGEGREGAHAPAVLEFAVDGDRRAPVLGQVAADVELGGIALADVVIGRDMAGDGGIVLQAEMLVEVALLGPVRLDPEGEAAVDRGPEHFARDARIHPLEIAGADARIEVLAQMAVFRQRQALDREIAVLLVFGEIGAHVLHHRVRHPRAVVEVAHDLLPHRARQHEPRRHLVARRKLGSHVEAERVVRVEDRGFGIGRQRPLEPRIDGIAAHEPRRVLRRRGDRDLRQHVVGIGVFHPLEIRAAEGDRGQRHAFLHRRHHDRLDRGRQGARRHPRDMADRLRFGAVGLVAHAQLGPGRAERHRFEDLAVLGEACRKGLLDARMHLGVGGPGPRPALGIGGGGRARPHRQRRLLDPRGEGRRVRVDVAHELQADLLAIHVVKLHAEELAHLVVGGEVDRAVALEPVELGFLGIGVRGIFGLQRQPVGRGIGDAEERREIALEPGAGVELAAGAGDVIPGAGSGRADRAEGTKPAPANAAAHPQLRPEAFRRNDVFRGIDAGADEVLQPDRHRRGPAPLAFVEELETQVEGTVVERFIAAGAVVFRHQAGHLRIAECAGQARRDLEGQRVAHGAVGQPHQRQAKLAIGAHLGRRHVDQAGHAEGVAALPDQRFGVARRSGNASRHRECAKCPRNLCPASAFALNARDRHASLRRLCASYTGFSHGGEKKASAGGKTLPSLARLHHLAATR